MTRAHRSSSLEDDGGASRALLYGSRSPSPTLPTTPMHRGFRRPGRLRRWWRPLAILGVPLVLFVAYAVLQPMVPALPALPSIHIGTGDGSAAASKPPVITPQSCLCGVTERGRELCNVYQQEGLRSSRLVEGSGARVRRLLTKAREGHDLKVGVLGGSVSACRGVHPSPTYPEGDPAGPGCYTSLVEQWFHDTFPQTKAEFFNGAIGGMDSSYYAFCGTHHIPTDVDLIILEFDVNDQSEAVFQMFFDQLLRVLLELPSEPAVVILGAWAPQVAQDQGYGDPQIIHLPIALYYDVPYISLKRLIFQHYLRFPESTAKTFFLPDYLHPNARGHRVLADLLVAFFESELCMLNNYGLPIVPPIEQTVATSEPASKLVELSVPLKDLRWNGSIDWNAPPEGWEETFDLDKLDKIGKEQRKFALSQTPYSLPSLSTFTPLEEVIDPYSPDPDTPDHILSIPQPSLFCADANDPEHPMQPKEHDGWEPYDWKGEKHYWVSSTPGARITVDIKVSAGRVAIYYFRSSRYDLGDARCWVDDNEGGSVQLAGYWQRSYNMAYVSYIDRNVTTGNHYVTCEIAQETSHPTNPDAHHFRIVAVMAT